MKNHILFFFSLLFLIFLFENHEQYVLLLSIMSILAMGIFMSLFSFLLFSENEYSKDEKKIINFAFVFTFVFDTIVDFFSLFIIPKSEKILENILIPICVIQIGTIFIFYASALIFLKERRTI